jgi:hypothetical protein
MRGRPIAAVLYRSQLLRPRQYALREQESGGQLQVGARCSHDDGERFAVQPDFERLFRCGAIGRWRQFAAAHSKHVDRAE